MSLEERRRGTTAEALGFRASPVEPANGDEGMYSAGTKQSRSRPRPPERSRLGAVDVERGVVERRSAGQSSQANDRDGEVLFSARPDWRASNRGGQRRPATDRWRAMRTLRAVSERGEEERLRRPMKQRDVVRDVKGAVSRDLDTTRATRLKRRAHSVSKSSRAGRRSTR